MTLTIGGDCDKLPPEILNMGRRKRGDKRITPREIALLGAHAAESQKAEDVVILDLRNLALFADYFLICSGASPVQVRSIASSIEENLSRAKVKMGHQEGYEEGKWILLDYGEVIFHIYLHQTRLYYALERLWGDAKRVKIPAEKIK